MALVELGADVALVAGRHGSRVRISGRSGREANRSGLNLAEILGRTAKEFGGEGGGHRSAAAMEATGEAATILAACRRKVAASLLQEPVP